jgi:hypothetical protein
VNGCHSGWPLNSYFMKRSIRIQKGLSAARDKRMGVLSELIGAVHITTNCFLTPCAQRSRSFPRSSLLNTSHGKTTGSRVCSPHVRWMKKCKHSLHSSWRRRAIYPSPVLREYGHVLRRVDDGADFVVDHVIPCVHRARKPIDHRQNFHRPFCLSLSSTRCSCCCLQAITLFGTIRLVKSLPC